MKNSPALERKKWNRLLITVLTCLIVNISSCQSINYCTDSYLNHCLTQWKDQFTQADWFDIAQIPVFIMDATERQDYCSSYHDAYTSCFEQVNNSCSEQLASEASAEMEHIQMEIISVNATMTSLCSQTNSRTDADPDHFLHCLQRTDTVSEIEACNVQFDTMVNASVQEYCGIFDTFTTCLHTGVSSECSTEAATYVTDHVISYRKQVIQMEHSCAIDESITNIATVCDETAASQCMSDQLDFWNANYWNVDSSFTECNNLEVTIAEMHSCVYENMYNCEEETKNNFYYVASKYYLLQLALNDRLNRCLQNVVNLPISADNACEQYVTLAQPQRSTAYSLAHTQTSEICDSEISESVWYRFSSSGGSQMTDVAMVTSVASGQCGSDYPLWAQSAHPYQNSESDNPGDYDYAYSLLLCMAADEEDCFIHQEIYVKKCVVEADSDFYVYNLRQQVGCGMSYCAGTCQLDQVWNEVTQSCIDRCQPGKIWNTRVEHCLTNGSVPDVGSPSLNMALIDGVPAAQCHLNYVDQESFREAAVFKVDWQTEDMDYNETMTVRGNVDIAQLDGISLQGYLGQNLKCTVTPYWDGLLYDMQTLTSHDSNEFFLGFIVPSDVTLYENHFETIQLFVESTIPICSNCLSVSYLASTELSAENCAVDVSDGNYGIEISLKTKPDLRKKIAGYRTNLMFQDLTDDPESVFFGYEIPGIEVEVIDLHPFYHCFGLGGTVKTAEGGISITASLVGYINLWSVESRNFYVYIKKSDDVTICAVLIHEGGDRYEIDVCNEIYPVLSNLVSVNEQSFLGRDSSGKQHQILLATGADIRVYIVEDTDRRLSLMIHIYAPQFTDDDVTGLCWSDSNSDLNSYSITEEEYCEIASRHDVFSSSCPCADSESVCSSTAVTNFISAEPVDSTSRSCSSRKKRQVSSGSNSNLEWPTASGITEQDAETNCLETFQNTIAYQTCQNIVNMSAMTELCLHSVQIMDSYNGTQTAITTMEESCVFEIQSNISVGSESELTEVAELETLQQSICPAQCSGHGTCVDSICQCDSGYVGSDCSFTSGQPPTIWLVENTLLDVQLQHWSSVRVYGHGFWNSDQLHCRLRNVTLSENGNIISEDFLLTTASLNNAYDILCEIDTSPVTSTFSGGYQATAHGYQLSVTTDGINFSEEHLIVVYNSTCQSCENTGICSTVSGTCSYDGVCRSGTVCEDPCVDYTDIGDPKRSTNYSIHDDPSAPVLCDHISVESGNWYRFIQYSGEQMPESCVEEFHCGTVTPIWLQSTHPTEAAPGPVVATVCGNAESSDGNCCEWSEDIEIKYCAFNTLPPYFVYKLAAVPSCEMAYCSGSGEVCAEGYFWETSSLSCQDIDECQSDPCQNGGNCTEGLNVFHCDCAAGFAGDNCEINVDDCESSPCVNDATCNDEVNAYSCTCHPGFTGELCETDIDECLSHNCNSGSTCLDQVNQYSCLCPASLTGSLCQFGMWSDWSEWSACSTTCSYGYSTSSRQCDSTSPCIGDTQRFSLCTQPECQDNGLAADDEYEGIIMTIPRDSLLQAVIQENELKTFILHALQTFFETSNIDQCGSLELQTLRVLNGSMFSNTNHVSIDYREHPTEPSVFFFLHVVVSLETSEAAASCSIDGAIRETHFVSSGILNIAVNNFIEDIEEGTSLQIVSVEKTSDVYSEETTTVTPQTFTYVPLMIACAIFGTALALISLCIIRGIYLNKNKVEKQRKSGSKVSVRPIIGPSSRPITPASIFSASQIHISGKDRPFSGSSSKSGWTSRPMSGTSYRSDRLFSPSTSRFNSRPMTSSSSRPASGSIIPAISISNALNPKVTTMYEGIAHDKSFSRDQLSSLSDVQDRNQSKSGFIKLLKPGHQ